MCASSGATAEDAEWPLKESQRAADKSGCVSMNP